MNSEQFQSLPQWARDYIAAIETNCDPAGMVRENMQLRDVVRELEASNVMLRIRLGETR